MICLLSFTVFQKPKREVIKNMKKLIKKDVARLAEKGITITISNDGLVKEKITKRKHNEKQK